MDRDGSQNKGWLRTPSGIALVGFLVVAGVLLLTEHRAHVLGALPYLLLLACPLLHVFHHHGHAHRHQEARSTDAPEDARHNRGGVS